MPEQDLTALWVIIPIFYLTVFGAAGAYVSGEKGRSGMEGALLAIFFGPFGLIVAACLPDRTARPLLDRIVDHMVQPQPATPPVTPPVPERAATKPQPARPDSQPKPRRLLGEVQG